MKKTLLFILKWLLIISLGLMVGYQQRIMWNNTFSKDKQ